MKTKILFLLLVIGLVFVSCEAKHHHEWTSKIEKEPTCEGKGILLRTCPCGETQKEVLPATGHKDSVEKVKKPATCTENGFAEKICPVCGKVFSTIEIEKVAHTPSEAKTVKEPTCEETGKEEIRCSICNALIEEKEVPAKDHELLETGKVIIKNATCIEDGLESGVCRICGKRLENSVIHALGHDWGETITVKKATCTEEGEAKQVCKRNSEHVRKGVIKMEPHNFDDGEAKVIKEATCTEKGKIQIKCKNCSTTTNTYTDALGHNFTIDQGYKEDANGNPIEPTQFNPGIKIYKCERCDATEEREVESESKHIHMSIETGYADDDNKYGRNIKGTCVKKARVGIYCYCYEGDDGKFYASQESAPSGVKVYRYCVGLKERDLDPSNHKNLEMIYSEGDSYFYGSLEKTECKDCNTTVKTTINEEGKISATGRWKGDMSGIIQEMPYSFDFDISLYENGISVSNQKYSIANTIADYIEMSISSSPQEERSHLSVNRATDGRWVGKQWITGIDNSICYLNPIAKEYISGGIAISVIDCNTRIGEEKIDLDMFGDSSKILELKKEEFTNEKSLLTIANFIDLMKIDSSKGEVTCTSFSKSANGIDTISIPSGTESINLEWVTLQGNEPTAYTWTVDGTTQEESNSTFTLTLSTKPVTVTCTANGETHSAIFSVQK